MAKRLVITGVKKIDRKLGTLEPKVAKKVIRQAQRKAMKSVQAAAKANAPADESGAIPASIKVRAGKRSRYKQTMFVNLGDRSFAGEAAPGGYFYPVAVEFGTSEQPAQGFMRRAYDSRADAAKRQMLAEITAGIEREAKAKG